MRKSLSFKLTVFAANILLCGRDLVLYCECGRSDRYCCKTWLLLPRTRGVTSTVPILHWSGTKWQNNVGLVLWVTWT